MFLVIDIGNTRQKAAIFNKHGEVVELYQSTLLSPEELQPLLARHAVQAAILSSVGNPHPQLSEWLAGQVNTLTFSTRLRLPLTIGYHTPETLGTDRIAAAIGANSLYNNTSVLVIQAGTCLVTDFVSRDNEYRGGSISPGLRMRCAALPHFTARLPLVEPILPTPITGQTTEESILSGTVNGFLFEIEGFIHQYQTQYPDLITLLTGGDAPMLSGMIKNRIFAAPNLVLLGLFKTLILNVSETQ
jgi:type III pantothenate kinase